MPMKKGLKSIKQRGVTFGENLTTRNFSAGGWELW
jgi:hypothetical protein